MNIQFGITDNDRCHHDTSNSFLGAKQYATRNNYFEVSCRFNGGYNVVTLATKKAGKWQLTSYGADLQQRGII